jgi:hypothetical protein
MSKQFDEEFWRRVEACPHDFTDYSASGYCGGAEGCSGWSEDHCRKCGVYITSCPCGCSLEWNTTSHKQRAALAKADPTA